MMNPDLNELWLLSGLFYFLGLLTIRISGRWNRTMLISIGTYTLMVGVGVYLTEIKWLLLGAIVFMLIASFYTLWILHGQFNACIREIKESDAQAQGGNNDANA